MKKNKTKLLALGLAAALTVGMTVGCGNGDIGNTWYVPGYGKQGSSRIGGSFNIIFEL